MLRKRRVLLLPPPPRLLRLLLQRVWKGSTEWGVERAKRQPMQRL